MSMAHKVGFMRRRGERVVVDENNAARRPGAAPGWVVICAMFAGAAVYALGGLLERLFHH